MAIETEILVHPEKVSVPIIAWLILITMGLTLILLLPAFFLILPIRNYCAAKLSARKGQEAKEAILKYIGKQPAYFNASFAGHGGGYISGTGIALSDGTLYIMDKGVAGKIPLSGIRSWRWQVPSADQVRVIGGGLAEQHSADIENMNSAHLAYLQSGMFVTVADVDKPEWQFMSVDVALLKRWAEILRQAGEGKLD